MRSKGHAKDENKLLSAAGLLQLGQGRSGMPYRPVGSGPESCTPSAAVTEAGQRQGSWLAFFVLGLFVTALKQE